MKPAQLFALLRLLCLAVLMTGALPAQAQSTCQSRVFNGHEDRVSAAYIAYYGRPADTGGLAYWAGQLAAQGGNLGAIIDAFGNSAEYRQRFGSLSNRELIRNLYQQLYGRDPDMAGWAFYEMWLDTGVQSLASIAISIMDGTEGGDTAILDNRKTVARHFITRMEALGAAAPAITDGSLLADLMAATVGDSASAATTCERMDELINTSTTGSDGDVTPALAQVVLFPGKPYYAVGEAISWQIEAAYQNQQIAWSIDGTRVQTATWSTTTSGTYRLRGEVKNDKGIVVAYAYANIVVASLRPLLTVSAGTDSASNIAVSSGTQLDGLSAKVPAQAVVAGTQIRAFAVDADPVPFTGLEPISPVIEMQPLGTQFAQPVQIRMPFDLSSLAIGEQLWITRYSGGEIDHLLPAYLDYEANEVVFETDHFSFFKLEKGGIFQKSDSEKFLSWVRGFMGSGFCAYDDSGKQRCWDMTISDENLSRALNTPDKDSTTPYDLLVIFHAAEKAAAARGKSAAQEGAAISDFINGPALDQDSLIIRGFAGIEKIAKRIFPGADIVVKPLLDGYKVYRKGVQSFDNACLRTSVNVLADWRKYYPDKTLKQLVQHPDIGRKEPGYWPNAIGCISLPGRVDMNNVTLDEAVEYLFPLILYLEMVDSYNKTSQEEIENFKKDLLFATQNYNIHTRTQFEYTPVSGPYSGIPQYFELGKGDDKDGALVRLLEGAKFITISPKPSLVPTTGIPLITESVSIIGSDGVTRLSTGTFFAEYIVKPGLNVLMVETIAYWEERTQTTFKKHKLKSVKRYKIFVPNSKKVFTATSAELGTASLSRDKSKIKIQVKPTFQSAAARQLAYAQSLMSAAQSQTQESYVKATYAINIQCGPYKVQAGQDGMLQVDANLLNSGSLTNCTAHVIGTQDSLDEDEILASTFAINLGSALSVATASALPTDRAVVGVLAVNGQNVDKPRQERIINAGDAVDFVYYVPQGAAILAADPDGSGHYGAFQGVPVNGQPGFYTQRIRYPLDTQGTRRPVIKVRINGLDSTASAPELLVKLAASLPPAVRISPQSAQVAVGETVTLDATITGEYSTIIWQKLQGPAAPLVRGTLVTPQLRVRLTVAGTYVLAAKVCNGGNLCTSQSVTVQVGTVPDNPPQDGDPIYLYDSISTKLFSEGGGWTYSSSGDYRYSSGGLPGYISARQATHSSLLGGGLLPVRDGVAVEARVSFLGGDQDYGYGVFLACWDSSSAAQPKEIFRTMITRSGLYRADTNWGMGQVIQDWNKSSTLQGNDDAVIINYIGGRIYFTAGNFAYGSFASFGQTSAICSHVSAGVYSSTNVSAAFKYFQLRHMRFASNINNASKREQDIASMPVHAVNVGAAKIASATIEVPPSLPLPAKIQSSALSRLTTTNGAAPNAPLHSAQFDATSNMAFFLSRASNLLPGALGGVQHLYGFDPASRTLRRLSQAPSGEAANADTTAFSLAAEAGKLVFRTQASNLEGGPGLYLLDLETGTRRPLLTALQHGGSDPGADNPVLGTTGQGLAFDAPDAAGRLQVFTAALGELGLHDLRQETPIDGQSIEACCAALSGDGRYLAWQEVGHDDRVLARVLDLASDKTATIDWPKEAATGQVLRLVLSENGALLHWLAMPDTVENAAPLHGVANPLFVPTERLH